MKTLKLNILITALILILASCNSLKNPDSNSTKSTKCSNTIDSTGGKSNIPDTIGKLCITGVSNEITLNNSNIDIDISGLSNKITVIDSNVKVTFTGSSNKIINGGSSTIKVVKDTGTDNTIE